ncbi:MAG: hypothetical protein ACREJ2_08435, partial [Planctomycetota bacterium]
MTGLRAEIPVAQRAPVHRRDLPGLGLPTATSTARPLLRDFASLREFFFFHFCFPENLRLRESRAHRAPTLNQKKRPANDRSPV